VTITQWLYNPAKDDRDAISCTIEEDGAIFASEVLDMCKRAMIGTTFSEVSVQNAINDMADEEED
jgi:hypothetical protein